MFTKLWLHPLQNLSLEHTFAITSIGRSWYLFHGYFLPYSPRVFGFMSVRPYPSILIFTEFSWTCPLLFIFLQGRVFFRLLCRYQQYLWKQTWEKTKSKDPCHSQVVQEKKSYIWREQQKWVWESRLLTRLVLQFSSTLDKRKGDSELSLWGLYCNLWFLIC